MRPSTVDQEPDYSPTQKLLHWLHAALILALLPVGFIMARSDEGPTTDMMYELHKSFGMTVFILAVIRVAYRIAVGVPQRDSSLPGWQQMAAEAMHKLLYVLIFLVPILGYVGTAMCCKPVLYFWSLPATLPIDGSEDMTKLVFNLHFAAALVLAGLVIGHIGAALYHGFIRRDAILSRMLPRGSHKTQDSGQASRS
jgi:cytochrome b561